MHWFFGCTVMDKGTDRESKIDKSLFSFSVKEQGRGNEQRAFNKPKW